MASTAVVTGATGFLGSELVKQLLQKGYDVNATVRDPDNQAQVQHLVKLGEALPGRLKLFQADLLKPGAFDQAVANSHIVFHTA